MNTNFALFSENLDYALGWMVIHSLWQAMAIALVMGIAMIVLRKKPAKLRYWVANAALLMVFLAAVATFAYYYDFSKKSGEVRFIPENTLVTTASGLQIAQPVETKEVAKSALSWDNFKDYFNQHIPLIVLVWVMGVALFILKLLGGISYCYYLRSRLNFPADEYWVETLDKLKDKVGVKQSIELVESALTRTPMVVGHLKPMILFPIGAINKLSPTEVEAILAHEIAHVMRKDFIFNIIQSVIEALFYYHPAVWLISNTIRNERENCCDDVAIEICGNSMNYAKALVTVQEMAYYPMYQPALAFAGNRKNQLLYRVQRILNQPQNKTNALEKLIATCMLVVVMMGLSFGEKSFANNIFNENTPPSVSGANLTATTPENPVSAVMPVSPKEAATFYLYFKDRIDSLKVPDDVPSGKYEYKDNIQDAELTVRNHYVVALKVNNIDLKDEQLPNYKRLIDKIIRNKKPTAQTGNPLVDKAFDEAGISFSQNGMRMDNEKAHLSVDDNGFQLNGVDESGQTYNLSIDKNGMRSSGLNTAKQKDPYNTLRFKAENGFSYVVFDLNGEKIWKCYENERLLGDLVMKNNSVKYEGREATSAELLSFGLVKYNNALNPKTGAFQIVSKDINGRAEFPEDTKAFRARLETRLKALSDKGLALKRSKGIDVFPQINPTLNDAGRDLRKNTATLDDLRNTERKLDWVETYIENKEDHADDKGDNDENKDDLQKQIDELKQDIKELRQEIKECDCTTNFDFRKGLMERLGRLFPVAKAQNQQVFHAFELRFLEIKTEWERGECDD